MKVWGWWWKGRKVDGTMYSGGRGFMERRCFHLGVGIGMGSGGVGGRG